MTKDEIGEIVALVKEELKKDSMNERLIVELKNIDDKVTSVEENTVILDKEKAMHIASLKAQRTQLEIVADSEEKAKAMNDAIIAYNNEAKVRTVNIASNDGKGVVEIRVADDKFESFEALLDAGTEYWDKVNEIIESV